MIEPTVVPTVVPIVVRSGRPRDDSRDAVILGAALELVAELGYDRVSMDAVAARAHASKATIYRRWSSKGALVAAAVRCRTGLPVDVPDTGALRSDLLALLALMAQVMGEQDLGLLTGVFAGVRTDPDLAEALRCEMFEEKVSLTAPLFARANRRGESVRPDANALLHEVAPPVVLHRLAVTGLPADDEFRTHLVDDVLIPILCVPPTPTPIPASTSAPTPDHSGRTSA